MLTKETITLVKAICEKCGYQWHTRTEVPKRCPQCKRPDWNKPLRTSSSKPPSSV